MADDEKERIDRLAQTGAGQQDADRPTSTDGVGGDSPTGAIEDMTGPGRIEPDGTADAASEGDAEALRHEEQEQQG